MKLNYQTNDYRLKKRAPTSDNYIVQYMFVHEHISTLYIFLVQPLLATTVLLSLFFLLLSPSFSFFLQSSPSSLFSPFYSLLSPFCRQVSPQNVCLFGGWAPPSHHQAHLCPPAHCWAPPSHFWTSPVHCQDATTHYLTPSAHCLGPFTPKWTRPILPGEPCILTVKPSCWLCVPSSILLAPLSHNWAPSAQMQASSVHRQALFLTVKHSWASSLSELAASSSSR